MQKRFSTEKLLTVICIAWGLFHLYTAFFGVLTAMWQRSILLAVALLCVGLVGCGGQDDQKITNLSIGGAGTSGTFYILGAAYCMRQGFRRIEP